MLSGCITGCITFRAAMRPAPESDALPLARGQQRARVAVVSGSHPGTTRLALTGSRTAAARPAFARYREPASGSLEDYGVCGADLF